MALHKPRIFIYWISILISLLIITDYVLPGTEFVDTVVAIKKERQQYYNAAGNSHFSYKLVTNKHDFLVSESFARTIKEHQEIRYTTSKLFSKVNSYSSFTSKSTLHSLRLFSGLIFPLIAVFIMGIAYRFNKKWDILIFVTFVALIVNLVFIVL